MRHFYSIDGDRVGVVIDQLVFSEKLEELSAYSIAVTTVLDGIRERLEGSGAKTVFCAGDSLLAHSETLIELANILDHKEPPSFSAGVGPSPRLAALALKQAKALGGSRIVVFSSGVQHG